MVVITIKKGTPKTILSYEVQKKLLGEINLHATKYRQELRCRFEMEPHPKYLGGYIFKSKNGHLVFESIFDTKIGAFVMEVKK